MMERVWGKGDGIVKYGSHSQHWSCSVVGVAVKGNKKSEHVLQWALDKFVAEGTIVFKLIHVHASAYGVPTPMGNGIPMSQVRNDVAAAFKKEVEWQTNQILLPYKEMCDQRKVLVDAVVIESDDVATAIAEEVAKCTITKLVIGASSHVIFASKLKGVCAKISACSPRFCTVYAVSKGKLFSLRPSDLEVDESPVDDNSATSCSTNTSSNYTSTSLTDSGSVSSYFPLCSSSLSTQRYQALSTINQTLQSTRNNHSTNSEDTDYALRRASSCRGNLSDIEFWNYYQSPTRDFPPAIQLPSPDRQENVYLELEKLRIELKHAQGMQTIAENLNINASQKLNNLTKRRLEESMKLKEIISKEEMAKKVATREREKCEAAQREAAYFQRCAEEEAIERREAEIEAARAARNNERLEDTLSGSKLQHKNFTWDEIVSATSSFSQEFRIGSGACGTVYKCNLYHTTGAVKVLHSKENHSVKQLQQELEILSRIRHPNLLLLLGACPDQGCLVYEYMDNGSLEDRLLQKNGTTPIPWFKRYEIAWEVASALAFLHSWKPKAIIHRDLKPANILLDGNLVSKIGDIGLSAMLHSDTLLSKETQPVGTLSYIDPEYQRTGILSPKSDVYAFGIVILQLLTAKPARALTHVVETAIDDGNLVDILDAEAGNWPFQETLDLARLGLSCAELRRRDRPDLSDHILPMLERLKEVADRAAVVSSTVFLQTRPPNHFICPILQDVMEDPCVAGDGYTYDHKAIVTWLQKNDKSPITNMPLPHKNLIPNYTLLSAILEWKSEEESYKHR